MATESSMKQQQDEQQEDYSSSSVSLLAVASPKHQDVATATTASSIQNDNITTTKRNTTKKIWFREEDNWELTWPIYHMLSHEERKSLASKYGYSHIGEFEEFLTLQRAVGETTILEQQYDNHLFYAGQQQHESKNDGDLKPKAKPTFRDGKKSALKLMENEQENEDDDDSKEEESVEDIALPSSSPSSSSSEQPLDHEDLVQQAGNLLILPEELIHKCLEWLPMDVYATCALVSPYWRFFTGTEAVYKRLCERSYLNQSKRRVLNPAKFGHSYRNMLELRPRVRAGGGLYVMKYSTIKKVQRDMWTEVPPGAILETIYYRYLYFLENGTVLYALSNDPPHEMIRRFWNVLLHPPSSAFHDKQAVWGRYQVSRNKVTVVAEQSWQVVRLELSILAQSGYGKFGSLSFDRHTSSTDGSFDSCSDDFVEYKVPNELFRFIKNRRL